MTCCWARSTGSLPDCPFRLVQSPSAGAGELDWRGVAPAEALGVAVGVLVDALGVGLAVDAS
ncbi:hypothetical protein C1I93_23290, partial [Micromonospora endophytica]